MLFFNSHARLPATCCMPKRWKIQNLGITSTPSLSCRGIIFKAITSKQSKTKFNSIQDVKRNVSFLKNQPNLWGFDIYGQNESSGIKYLEPLSLL